MIELFSKEAEEALLGLFLKETNIFYETKEAITTEDFYLSKNQFVFSALLLSYEFKKSTDPIIVSAYLASISNNKNKEEWLNYLSDLILASGISVNTNKYVDVIREKSQTRILEKTLKESMDFVTESEQPVQTLVEKIESKIFNVTRDRELKNFSSVEKLTKEFSIKVENIKKYGYQEGIGTGLIQLDEKIGGLKPGDFVIIAARPAMGKTAFALEFASHVAKKNTVAFYSIEMPSEQLIQRMISTDALIKINNFNQVQNLTSDQQMRMEVALDNIKKLNFWIDDTPGIKLNELVWKARKLNSMQKIDLIIIDYLQLIETDNYRENRQLAVTQISRTLKQLARELKIPVVALSQLSRRVEQRENKKPQMSDIRESGAIEQDADLIMFLYREDYYKEKEDQPISDVHNLDVIISKHRSGPTGTANLKINMAYGKVTSSFIKKGDDF